RGAERGVPGLDRLAEVARPRRGHPRTGRRQGPQPAVVAGDPRRCHRGRRRRLLPAARRSRTRARRSQGERPMSELPTVAFLGLGHMGGPMAANLVRAGYTVNGYDPVPAAQEEATKNGITVAEAATDAVRGAQVVITMLPNGKLVLDLYDEILPAAEPNTLFVDSSTIDVADARAAAEKARTAGHRAVDAPVSGGVAGAAAGTLAFMVGGSEDDCATAKPLLEAMGRKIVHCGGSGNGQAAKICNNMILGISMIAISEAFVLGEKLGLDNQALFDVASNASGQCWALTSNCPVPGPVPTTPANN